MRKLLLNSKDGAFCLSLVIFILFFLFVSTCMLQAQVKGRITGRVFNAETERYLPGANVYLEGTQLGAASDRAGEYTIFNVPPGSYTIKADYIGYEEYSAEVTIPQTGGITGHDVALKSTFLEAGEIVVVGMREGQAKALNQQKTAANVMNVVAEEQMKRFPDLNTAEVLQRIPAVAITRDQGEGRFILIRGTEARLNAVSVNGERIASPEDEERFVGMDVISTNQVASIEVTKAITPDMDADAIGGSVNLVTKSAFDHAKQVFNFDLGAGYGNLRGDPLYQADFTYSNRFGPDKKFGFTINGNYYDSNRGNDDNEMEWGSEDDVNDNEIPWALQDLQLRYYSVDRERYGIGSTLEFRPDDKNRYYVSGMYNRRDDYEYRDRLRIRPDKGTYQNRTLISGAAIERELKDRLEAQTIYSVSGGGQNALGNWKLDYNLAYSYGEEKKHGETDPNFELDQDVDLRLDLSDTEVPQYTITNQANRYEMNAEHFVLDEISWSDNKNNHSEFMGTLNLRYPFLLGENSSELKFGGKARLIKKKRDDEEWAYGWDGDDDILMSRFVSGENITDYQGGAYDEFGPLVDGDKVRDFFKANRDKEGRLVGELDVESKYGGSYEANENIYAWYGMVTTNIDRLMILAGLRHEMTQIEFEGNELLFNEDGDYESHKPLKQDLNYQHFLPMVHFKYNLTPQTNLRLAFTSSLARPNYYDHVPYRIVFREDEEMELGNPKLKSTTAYNIDLFAEHYLTGIGVISGGFFYKALDKIIFNQTYEQVGGPYDGYEVSQPVNGEKATVLGFEIAWQQQFTFLPDFWNGFGIYANYSWSDSKADLPGRKDSALPGQAKSVANLALIYEKYGFTGRISMNYHGNFIEGVGEDPEHDRIYDNHVQWDFAASQRIYEGLQFYLEVINISDEPLRYYIGDTNRPLQREFYSWWIHSGMKFEL